MKIRSMISLVILVMTVLSLAQVIKGVEVREWALKNGEDRFSFVVFGDTRPLSRNTPIPEPFLDRVFEEISWLRPDFVIHMGDIVYGFGESAETIKGEYEDFLRIYKDRAGDIPMIVVPANHELQPGERAFKLFKEYFGGELYYDFRFGSSHFIVLNTNFPKSMRGFRTKYGFYNINDGFHDEGMVDWFTEVITQEASHTFVFSHVPLFTVRGEVYENADPTFMSLIKDVDAYITAHRHFTYFSREGKVHLFVVGGGGTSLDRYVLGKCDVIHQGYECGPLGIYSYLLVDVTPVGVKYKIIVPFSVDVMEKSGKIYVINRTRYDLTFRGIGVEKEDLKATLIMENGVFMPHGFKLERSGKNMRAVVWVPAHSVVVLKSK